MKNWNSVEEKWREQLQNKSEDIPEGLWSRLEERLEEKPARRFPIYWAAAAMLLMALGLSWNFNPPGVDKTSMLAKTEKTSPLEEKIVPEIATQEQSPLAQTTSTRKDTEQTPTSIPAAQVAALEENPTEEVVAVAPVLEKNTAPEEILTVRVDIDPVIEEENKPAFTQQKRRRSLLGKIVGEIRQALDGEPVNWQKLKEGNSNFENSIHNVANTYVKTEENLKRTLQIQ